MPRENKDSKSVFVQYLQAMDGQISDARRRISGNQDAGSYVGPAVFFMVCRDRELMEVDLRFKDFLNRGRFFFYDYTVSGV